MIRVVRLFMIVIALFAILSAGFSIGCESDTSPSHNIDIEDIVANSRYWNSWASPIALEQKATELALLSNQDSDQDHEYVANQYDYTNKAISIWNRLAAGGDNWEPIISLIAIGNLDIEYETYNQANYAWLLILNQSAGGNITVYALEPTSGEMYLHTGIATDPNEKYFEGFFYASPSTLRAESGLTSYHKVDQHSSNTGLFAKP